MEFVAPPFELALVKGLAESEASTAANISASALEAQCGWEVAMLAAMASATSRSSWRSMGEWVDTDWKCARETMKGFTYLV